MKRYKNIIAVCMACILASTTVLAQELTQNDEVIQQQNQVYTSPIFIEGKATVKKSSTIYNINPYNPAKIEGLGESV